MDGIKDYTDFVYRHPKVEAIKDKIDELKDKKSEAIDKQKYLWNKGKDIKKVAKGSRNGGAYIPDGLDGLFGTKKPKNRKKASGTQTAAQKRNTARLKKVQAIARGLKAKNPRLKHTAAVKLAWKQM